MQTGEDRDCWSPSFVFKWWILVPISGWERRFVFYSKVSHLSVVSDVEMQAVCAHYARLYNEHDPPLKVEYVRSWLLKV